MTSESTPAWSPDGTRIAFVSDRKGGRSDLYVMNLRSGRLRRLTTTHKEETEPTWSPNGKRIAFARYPSPNNSASRILVVAADGDGLRMLSSKPYEQSPAWSPDGRTIVFVRTFEIYTMRADGSNVRRLTRDPRLDENPAWSPDGRKIAFISDRSGAFELWTMNADGTQPQRLTHDARIYHDTAIDWYR